MTGIKKLLKRAFWKGLLYGSISSGLFSWFVCYHAYRASLKFDSVTFSIWGALAFFLICDVFTTAVCSVFQVIKALITNQLEKFEMEEKARRAQRTQA